jgi:RHS repeat-associated protein
MCPENLATEFSVELESYSIERIADNVQGIEYRGHGQVAAGDVNHPNPITFTGRWFDKETGLYYYRARYYNPYIGRFLQTDPLGYGDGINWYRYCGNNPLAYVDPYGRLGVRSCSYLDPPESSAVSSKRVS